ncbi:ankyrin repeat-containing domain protein [Bombardia bombarda]|uniref:Ankyrin repeat-containing domain protein n=1 Tax=Bombardia bombarda TaxID=252184 RepID=A0AA39U076_9PEZI|nr:ankyrin repeat-containing domain protein [Bombardia bombarda]
MAMTSRNLPWERWKNAIHTLYVLDKRPLNEVRKEMKERYRFDATRRQYETQLKKWGQDFKKKTTSTASTATSTSTESMFPTDKLRKEISRYCMPTLEKMQLSQASSPNLPEGVDIRTPCEVPVVSLLFDQLPIFHFLSDLSAITQPLSDSIVQEVASLNQSIDKFKLEAIAKSYLSDSAFQGEPMASELIMKKDSELSPSRSITPLQLACMTCSPELVKVLIHYGAEVDGPEYGWKGNIILLSIASCFNLDHLTGFQEVIQTLIHAGAKVNIADDRDSESSAGTLRPKFDIKRDLETSFPLVSDGHSPLTAAAYRQCPLTVKLLLKSGADVSFRRQKKSSALRECLSSSSPSRGLTLITIVRSLVDYGVDVNDHVPCLEHHEGDTGQLPPCYSALDLALYKENTELVMFMISTGARPTNHTLDIAMDSPNNDFDLLARLVDYVESCGSIFATRLTHQDQLTYASPLTTTTSIQKKRILVTGALRFGALSALQDLIQSLRLSNMLEEIIASLDLGKIIANILGMKDNCSHIEALESFLGSLYDIQIPPPLASSSEPLIALALRKWNNPSKVVDLLIDNGASVELDFKQSLGLVQKLIAAGATTSWQRAPGNHAEMSGSALVKAIKIGENHTIEEALKAGVDINVLDGGWSLYIRKFCCISPLAAAIMTRKMVACGSPKGFRGRAEQLHAIWRSDLVSVDILLDHGASIRYQPLLALQKSGDVPTNTPVQMAVRHMFLDTPSRRCGRCADTQMLRHLLERGADPSEMSFPVQYSSSDTLSLYYTALQEAAKQKDMEVARLLLKHGADPNLVSPLWCHGHTALQFACWNGQKEMVDILLEYGANVNAPPDPELGATALQYAAAGLDGSMTANGRDPRSPLSRAGGKI